jgi:hypothetical protein
MAFAFFWGPLLAGVFAAIVGFACFIWRRPRNPLVLLAPFVPLALFGFCWVLLVATHRGEFQGGELLFLLLGAGVLSIPVGVLGGALLLVFGTSSRSDPPPVPPIRAVPDRGATVVPRAEPVPDRIRVCRSCGREMQSPFCPYCIGS